MSQIVTCPDCGRKLKVPDDLLGKKVKCPGCGQKFVGATDDADDESATPRSTGVAPRPDGGPRSRRVAEEEDLDGGPRSRRRVAEEEDDDRPKSRRRADEDEDDEDYPVRKRDRDGDRPAPTKVEIVTGWERVRFGLNLVIIGLWLLVANIVIGVLGYLILAVFVGASIGSMAGGMPTGGPMTNQQASQLGGQAAGTMTAALVGGCLLYGLMGLVALAYLATTMTGMGFCMGVAPTRKAAGLRGLAITAFSLSIAYLIIPLFTLGGGALMYRNGGGCVVIPGYGLWAIVFLAECICFMLFLRGVAVVMKKEGLAQNVLFSMIGNIVYALLAPIVPVVLAFAFGAALIGSFAASGPRNVSAAAGNAAGTGAAFAIGGGICMVLMFLIGLGLSIWYMVLVHQVRSAVSAWLDRN